MTRSHAGDPRRELPGALAAAVLTQAPRGLLTEAEVILAKWILFRRGLLRERPESLQDHDASDPGVMEVRGRDLVLHLPGEDALRAVVANLEGFVWENPELGRAPVAFETLRELIELRREGVLFTMAALKLMDEVFRERLTMGSHPRNLRQVRFYPSGVAEVRLGTNTEAWKALSRVQGLTLQRSARAYYGKFSRELRHQLKSIGFDVPEIPRTSPAVFTDTLGRLMVGGTRIKPDKLPWQFPAHGTWEENICAWILPTDKDECAAVLWELSERRVRLLGELQAEAVRGKAIAEIPPPDPAMLHKLSYAVNGEKIEVEGIAFPLKSYQHPAVTYAMITRRAFIADDMGLGKTIVSLAAMQKAGAFPCLVAAPASVCPKWIREVEAFLPGRSVSDQIGSGADIIVLSHNKLWDLSSAGLLTRPLWKGLIVDESHKFKEPKAKRTMALMKLVKVQPIGYRFCLTGTPIPNRPLEMESQLEILGRLQETFGGHYRFAEAFCVGDVTDFGKVYNGGTNGDLLNQKLRENCYIRRLKDDADKSIPPKSREFIEATITNQADYLKLNARFQKSLQEGGGSRLREQFSQNKAWWKNSEQAEQLGKDHPLVLLGQLRRMVGEGKLERAHQEIERLLDKHERLVVFCVHRNSIGTLKQHFPNALTIRGGEGKRKQAAIDAFAKPDGPRLILVSLLAAESGIELVSACASLTVEFWWEPSTMFQSEDRLARNGQTREVTNYYLTAPRTIDDFMRRMLSKKYLITRSATEGKKVRRLDLAEELERFFNEHLVA